MNFYEHQDRAQRRTKIIVFLFIVAVLFIIAVVEIPVAIATKGDPIAIGATAVFCILIVGISALVKLRQLRGGGRVVAEMLGGSLIQPLSKDQAERRIRNIVEEMAIASGMPVPPVYVIEDETINAFAAGWTPSDAVIGVTRGCINQLNRDELQGVIAHEFSHISHGDMRLNIRLIGIIFGIMVLGLTGWILVRGVGPAILYSSSRSRSKEGAGGMGIALGIIVFGLFLALCGAIGTLFGRLIQAAVSRQREFLADASAVQYTRNPSGIGGALRKIGGVPSSKTMHANAGQCNHMFFSQAVKAMFASHPPITERIARIEGIDVASLPESPQVVSKSGVVSHFSSAGVQRSIEDAGELRSGDIQLAATALANIDRRVRDALNDCWSARLVMFALLVDKDQKKDQDTILAGLLTPVELVEFRALLPLVSAMDRASRLPLIDLAAPALQQLSTHQRKEFDNILSSLIESDGVLDRFEWVFVSVLRKHLSSQFGAPSGGKASATLLSLAPSVSLVLGTLAYCGAVGDEQITAAYDHGIKVAGIDVQLPELKICTMGAIDKALKKLRSLRFTQRQLLLNACESCVTHDGLVTVEEAETLRAIGDILDCPIPMFH